MKITLDAVDKTKDLFLRQHVGEGSAGEYTFEITSIIPSGSPHIAITDPDGTRTDYVVYMQELVEAVVEGHING